MAILYRALLWALALNAVTLTANADLLDGVVYSAHQCTDSNPCDITAGPHGSTPTGDYLAGFNQDAFKSFYQSEGFHPTAGFVYSIKGTNSAGYVYGSVRGGGISMFDTQFIFHSGQLLCCTADNPYAINDLNDNGIFVGYNNGGFISYTSAIGSHELARFYPHLDADSAMLLGSAFIGSNFIGIDNDNDILVSRFHPIRGLFELVPIAVPEPSTLVLGLTYLLLGLGMYKYINIVANKTEPNG